MYHNNNRSIITNQMHHNRDRTRSWHLVFKRKCIIFCSQEINHNTLFLYRFDNNGGINVTEQLKRHAHDAMITSLTASFWRHKLWRYHCVVCPLDSASYDLAPPGIKPYGTTMRAKSFTETPLIEKLGVFWTWKWTHSQLNWDVNCPFILHQAFCHRLPRLVNLAHPSHNHNSINIRASSLKSLAFDREPNFS